VIYAVRPRAVDRNLRGGRSFQTLSGAAAGAFRNLQRDAMSQNLVIQVANKESFDVRSFNVDQQMNASFSVNLLVHAENPEVDFDAILGQPASFTMAGKSPRSWYGILSHAQQDHTDERGVSTYRLTVVPTLWLLAQRRNHRIFQQLSELEIVQKLLGEWGITPKLQLQRTYKKRKYRVQYGETDFDFLSRMLEHAGISFYFSQQDRATEMVLDDSPHANKPRGASLPFRPGSGNATHDVEHISGVDFKQRVRQGKYTVQDHDYRKSSSYSLASTAVNGLDVEQKLENYEYDPGTFLYRADAGGDTPVADDKGTTRSDEQEATLQAARRLAAKRTEGKRVSLISNAYDITPGMVLKMTDHPRADLGKPQLVTGASIHGTYQGEWTLHADCVSAEEAYYPPIKTDKPRTQGVESATVVGPSGDEIHCDEFGRIRVQFHWDREGSYDDNSSCWIHVNQPWGGAGYGASNLPRVGQEVLVDFLAGDPDRPVVTGRVYTAQQATPYKLPGNKTQSGWKSNSTGGSGGYNEIKFEDMGGKEVFSIQAQKDYQSLVKNDSSTLIGNDRTHTTVGNNTETVQQAENLTVMGQRAVTIMDSLSHWIKGDASTTSDQGNQIFSTAQTFMSSAKTHYIQSNDSIELKVGASRIVLTPDQIIIDGPLTYLNPGSSK
jgi:type VI secretion system secreted protein VgrG